MSPPVVTRRDLDWNAVCSKTQTFTADQLLSYNAAGIDPFLILVAQVLGQQFSIAAKGQRNLANAFASLPQAEFFGLTMGIGHSDRHPARLLANLDGGFDFLGICGCLSENYSEDVVVGVIVGLLKVFQIPDRLLPSDSQWRNLIHLCHGVLASSGFGLLITRAGTAVNLTGSSANIRTIIHGLWGMSDLVQGSQRKISIDAGSDAFWFAAVAEWLFDLSFVVDNVQGLTLLSSPGVETNKIQVSISTRDPSFREDSPDLLPLSEAFPNSSTPVTGGRVTWEKIFRSCFGRTFTDIESRLLADGVSSLAGLTAASIEHTHADIQAYFYPQASAVTGSRGSGLLETVTSWFPELRRLAPQMGRYANVSFQEARDKCDEVTATLKAECMCNFCGNASETSTEYCKHSLLIFILSLGLVAARSVVVTGLYPKRSGIIEMYRFHHERRKHWVLHERVKENDEFMEGFVESLPSPRQLLDTACLMFAGSSPQDDIMTDETLSIAHQGIFASLTAWNPYIAGSRTNQRMRAGVSVSTGSSHVHGRLVDQGVWSQGVGTMSFAESLEMLRTRSKDLQQIVRLKGNKVEFSYILLDSGEEERAQKAGWWICED
ncbi:hypothetical protein B0A52_02947 [Exophiala mesophila]|uniref:Uncharacterized protein n=1 Tax=Exophiala mesophila TaxID=212818 RepID=A0A438NC05_EXOME|nr:hypothetical protein B0A52_02947 [Exophiala mesophila]